MAFVPTVPPGTPIIHVPTPAHGSVWRIKCCRCKQDNWQKVSIGPNTLTVVCQSCGQTAEIFVG